MRTLSKREILLIVSFIILFVVVVWLGVFNASHIAPTAGIQAPVATTTGTVVNTEKISIPAASATHPQTFKSLFANNVNRECAYTQVGTVQGRNLVDLSQAKLYGAFRTTDSAGTAHNNLFVYDGHYLYTWQEGMTVGTKTTLTSLSQLPFAIPLGLQGGASYGTSDQSVSWDCHPWIPVPSLLVPPSYVTFSAR